MKKEINWVQSQSLSSVRKGVHCAVRQRLTMFPRSIPIWGGLSSLVQRFIWRNKCRRSKEQRPACSILCLKLMLICFIFPWVILLGKTVLCNFYKITIWAGEMSLSVKGYYVSTNHCAIFPAPRKSLKVEKYTYLYI